MNVLQAFVLGAIQGLTEFLPVSSSGHLVLAERILGIPTGSVTLEVLLHLGTLISVCLVYRRRILHMLRHPLKSELKWLVVATIPAVLLRLLYTDLFVKLTAGTAACPVFTAVRDHLSAFMENAFDGGFLGWAFLLTSVLLMLGDVLAARHARRHRDLRCSDAVVMGCMQAVAVLPGVSRSGSTIAGGRAKGLAARQAADFAFLMSIPAILGAVVMDGKDILTGEITDAVGALPMAVGVLSAMAFGFIAISGMLKTVRRRGLKGFAVYTGALGLLVLADQYLLHIFF